MSQKASIFVFGIYRDFKLLKEILGNVLWLSRGVEIVHLNCFLYT